MKKCIFTIQKMYLHNSNLLRNWQMKKILILSLIGLLFASCKKDEKDYREDFVGTYSCAIDEHYQRADTGEDTHSMSVDTIEVGMVDDSMLYFKSIPRGSYYFGSDKGHIKVEADGEFSLYDYGNWEVQAQGKFSNDSIVVRKEYKHRHEESTTIILGRKL